MAKAEATANPSRLESRLPSTDAMPDHCHSERDRIRCTCLRHSTAGASPARAGLARPAARGPVALHRARPAVFASSLAGVRLSARGAWRPACWRSRWPCFGFCLAPRVPFLASRADDWRRRLARLYLPAADDVRGPTCRGGASAAAAAGLCVVAARPAVPAAPTHGLGAGLRRSAALDVARRLDPSAAPRRSARALRRQHLLSGAADAHLLGFDAAAGTDRGAAARRRRAPGDRPTTCC